MNREEVDAKLSATEARVAERLAEFNTAMLAGFAEMRGQMADAEMRGQFAEMRAEMRGQFAEMRAEMRAEMHKNTVSLLKWGIGIAIAVVGITVSWLTYLD